MRRNLRRTSLLLAALLALAGGVQAQEPGPLLPRDLPGEDDLAVMGTIPIYWGERGSLTDLLGSAEAGHWARPLLERHFRLRPLDYLSAEALRGHTRVLLAQPRGLSAEENVALDAWVRGGGRLLLFADPQMTGDSHFGIGDRRRPQDVALLSPILHHWGLDLQYDESQPPGMVSVDVGIALLPANMHGRLVAPANGPCRALGSGLAARCNLGGGEVLVVADAALLDAEGPWDGSEQALTALVESVFPHLREIAGESGAALADNHISISNSVFFDFARIQAGEPSPP